MPEKIDSPSEIRASSPPRNPTAVPENHNRSVPEVSLTKRALELDRRAAFLAGARFQESLYRDSRAYRLTTAAAEVEAKARYPLPPIRRARELTDPHNLAVRWRYRPGVMFEVSDSENGGWQVAAGSSVTYWPTDLRVELWAALLASPIEEVPGE